MNEPIDQSNRQRFISELDRNFSVVAAAGSGKTRAITDRIVQIAKSEHARDWLPQLVVVAFTNRAADEMQQRARAEVLRAGVPVEVLAAFNRAFFGTIHAFCVRLLESYGHYLGLPPTFDVITDDDEIWNEFVQQQTAIGRSLSEENRRELLRHVQARALMELGRRADLGPGNAPAGKCPDSDFSAVYRFQPDGRSLHTASRSQKELKRAERIWREAADFVRWPICASKPLMPIWREAFAPVRRWIDQAALCVAAEVQRDYREFRIDRGLLTYDDQIALALELTKHPKIGREIREKSFRVILDEAQDTDPRQFSFLLELARPPNATGDWLETKNDGPTPGHFCMVGDFQQSIYRDRADLSRYRRIHEALVETGAAEALQFSVTFRLDTAQVDLVNETFREILNDREHQVAFVELNPRPQVLPGQVVRLNLQPAKLRPDPRGKVSDARKAAEEARQLGKWLQANGLAKLRAESWRDVAVLCPRKEWLQTLRRGLRAAGMYVQIQSERELKGDSPAYAWLTALLMVLSQPRAGYEIAGLLRELFGISDHDLAVFSQGYGDRFQIETLTTGADVVSKTLSLLAQLRLSILSLPLFDAINEIVGRTQLRERLNALPRNDFENLDGELDGLLALAGSSEADGMTLTEFAEHFRTHFADAREIRPSRPDAIQLITSQKAKGSEWQAVIVPFLTRDVRSASPRYPRLLKIRETGETIVLLDLSDATDEIQELLERENRQEMERLLYVALTRAQHTLVLAFDNELFAKSSGEIHSHSQSKWLKADKNEVNEAAFAAVATEPTLCALTTERHWARARVDKIDIQLPGAKIDKAVAIRNASVFARKLNPSGLPSEESAALEEIRYAQSATVRSTSPALRYGLWWHDFVQRLQWSENPDSWNRVFDQQKNISPDPARSIREWKLLLAHLSEPENFRRHFDCDKSIVHAEMPFFWQVDNNRCLEGVIDLAFFQRSNASTARTGKCLILDWKTDRVPPDNTETLHARYRPQLAAYWKAVSEIAKVDVEAAIYSTAAGALVRYKTAELDQEWSRLEKLPPDQFDVEVAAEVGSASIAPTTKQVQLEFPEL
ncbi:MAG TPA: UvrD-helicase domain-containing protein [Chthoniobacterales bacterium]|jgi:ATP-dependent helicase/nuclease subunit A|nr:UvrD-helicase domain-containing protein [Chthoniobacterales bacterium]